MVSAPATVELAVVFSAVTHLRLTRQLKGLENLVFSMDWRYNIEGSDLEDAGISCLCTPYVIFQNSNETKEREEQ